MSIELKPLVGKSLEAYEKPLSRLNIFDGAVRSGKTVTTLVKWARWIARGDAPPGTLMIAGKTERTVKQNLIDPLFEIFGDRYVKYSAGNHTLHLFGRKHIIVGANDERAEGKIRGITLAGVLGDEVTLWAESFFKMSLSRMSVKGAAFLGTTNPDSPAHWLNVQYLSRGQELGINRVQFTLRDNPNLPEEFVRSLEGEYVGLWRKRFILGEWVVAEGAVYDMFDPIKYGIDEFPEVPKWKVAGIDYGTTNPSVYASLSWLPSMQAFVVHDEWRWDSKRKARQLTAKEHSVKYFAWKKTLSEKRDVQGPRLDRVYVDPSANAFILQLFRDGEKSVRPGENDVNLGIMWTASLMGRGKLLFHRPTTKLLMEEFASYSWDDEATLKGEDKPMKVADHGPDAVRYAVAGSRSRWKHHLGEST